MKMIRIAAALALIPASIIHAKPQIVRPAIWKLHSATSTIYLFGTVHVLPKGVAWHTPILNKVEAKADTLVLEINDIDDKTRLANEFRTEAMAPNLPDVLDRVPAAKRAGLKALFDKAQIPPAALKPYKSWAVAITLASTMLKDFAFDPNDGVEHSLTADFTATHKPIEGLETSAQQFGYFNQLSPKAQEQFLVSLVDDAPKMAGDLNKMIAAWKSGNPNAIAEAFDKDMKSEPELQRVLLHERNARWTTWLRKRLSKPGVTLVAVGAGHLAGKDSVIAMLRTKGVQVDRVE